MRCNLAAVACCLTMSSRRGMKEKVVRPDVCLALLKMMMHLPSHSFDIHLRPLVMTVVGTLISRDVNIRDTARQTLGKMCTALGPDFVGIIFKELESQLSEGFKLFVRYAIDRIHVQVIDDLKCAQIVYCPLNFVHNE